MAELGVNPARVAEKAEVKPSFIYDIMNGKSTNPSVFKLAKVAKQLDVDISYFLGNSYQDNSPNNIIGDNDSVVKISSLLIEASAGGGSVTTIEVEGEPYFFRKTWIRDKLGVKPADLRIIWVRGDSMEPTLCNRDIILVDTTKRYPSPPGIFILFDGMGLVAKRLEMVSGSDLKNVLIKSDNPHYAAYTRSIEEINIVGRVVWFAREI